MTVLQMEKSQFIQEHYKFDKKEGGILTNKVNSKYLVSLATLCFTRSVCSALKESVKFPREKLISHFWSNKSSSFFS